MIPIYLLGYALGNFLIGFLSDSLGRQKILRVSLLLFLLSSLCPIFFTTISVLLGARFFQGMALGSIAVLTRSIFADLLEPEQLVRTSVMMGAMWGIGPIVGPVIGGYLQFYFNWQATFWFFSIAALISGLALIVIIPETHFNRHPLNFRTIKKNALEILSHKIFMSMVVLTGCIYSTILVFNTMAPFFIQTTLHYSSIFFGHIALCMGAIYLVSTLACRRMLKTYSVEKISFFSINTFFLLTICSLVLSFFLKENLTLVVMISAVMYIACGILFPMLVGKSIGLFRHISGTAGAIMYLISISITSGASFFAAFLHTNTTTPIISVYLILLFICFFISLRGRYSSTH